LGHHRRCHCRNGCRVGRGIQLRLPALGLGVIDRHAQQIDGREQHDRKENRDVALLGGGKASQVSANAPGEGQAKHDVPRNLWFRPISGRAAEFQVNLAVENRS